MESTDRLVQFAQALATDAGHLLQQIYQVQKPSSISQRQSPKGLKLVEDKTMDQWLIEKIQQAYPTHCLLTEESGLLHRADGECRATTFQDHSYLWVIDPIDGSVNFSTRNPFFSISIALVVDGTLTLGVIEAPLMAEQFVAVHGKGATVNGQPIHVSTTDALPTAYLLSCDGGAEDRVQVFSTLIRNYYDQVKDFRKLGSAALECAWVASGRADAYITMAIDVWDVAAGILLVEEAGGKVTTFDGGQWPGQKSDLLVSNGLLHEAMMDRIY